MTPHRILGLVAVAALWTACSNSDRKFSDDNGGGGSDASAGGSGAGTGGGPSGGAGGSAGGSAGTATGGSGGVVNGGTGGVAGGGAGGTDGGVVSCSVDSDCDNGNLCDGEESCVDGVCEAGTAAADGTVCIEAPARPDGGLDAGTPSAGDAGDGGSRPTVLARESICWQGACLPSCAQDSECNDGNVCNGTETCNPTSGTCQQGSPLGCDDGDACTANECDEQTGCFYPLIDEDGDGHAPDSLGACGDDCDDTDETTFTGAQELCDQKDNNCDGTADEGTLPTWYVDCDGDTFAAGTSFAVADQCDPPAAPTTTQCPDGAENAAWTSTEPTAGQTDCYDYNTRYRPRNSSENSTAWGLPSDVDTNAPVSVQHDFNCDGTPEQRYTTVVSQAASCTLKELPGPCPTCPGTLYCTGSSGWVTSVPACGSSGTWTYCSGIKTCGRTTRSDEQECR